MYLLKIIYYLGFILRSFENSYAVDMDTPIGQDILDCMNLETLDRILENTLEQKSCTDLICKINEQLKLLVKNHKQVTIEEQNVIKSNLNKLFKQNTIIARTIEKYLNVYAVKEEPYSPYAVMRSYYQYTSFTYYYVIEPVMQMPQIGTKIKERIIANMFNNTSRLSTPSLQDKLKPRDKLSVGCIVIKYLYSSVSISNDLRKIDKKNEKNEKNEKILTIININAEKILTSTGYTRKEIYDEIFLRKKVQRFRDVGYDNTLKNLKRLNMILNEKKL